MAARLGISCLRSIRRRWRRARSCAIAASRCGSPARWLRRCLGRQHFLTQPYQMLQLVPLHQGAARRQRRRIRDGGRAAVPRGQVQGLRSWGSMREVLPGDTLRQAFELAAGGRFIVGGGRSALAKCASTSSDSARRPSCPGSSGQGCGRISCRAPCGGRPSRSFRSCARPACESRNLRQTAVSAHREPGRALAAGLGPGREARYGGQRAGRRGAAGEARASRRRRRS